MKQEDIQSKWDRYIQVVLALGAMTMLFIMGMALLWRVVPTENQGSFGIVIGAIITLVTMAFKKWFGGADTDTRNSQNAQAETLSSAVDKLSQSTPTIMDPMRAERVDVSADTVNVSKDGNKS